MHNTPANLSKPLVSLMAVATGLAVASNYYAQPLLDTIARLFNLSVNQAGTIVTVAQLSYAAGLLFLVPLGDKFSRRPLVVMMTLLSASGLLITASSQSLWTMLLGTALTGLFSVVAQVLIPLGVSLASPETRGKVLGTIMSGLLLGILLARTISGILADIGGWRTVYWLAAGCMAIMALTLWRMLPNEKQDTRLNYPQLLISIFTLFRQDKILLVRMLIGFMIFANFSMLWTSMSFLLASAPFHFSTGIIGLFGLAGVAGALCARPAGAIADKGKAHITTTWGSLLLLFSWGLLALGGLQMPGKALSVLVLIAGILLLDLIVQGVHITNQSVIYHTRPDARNRLTAGYMTGYFIGGALASLASAWAYNMAGWAGVCLAGGILSVLNLIIWWLGYHRQSDMT